MTQLGSPTATKATPITTWMETRATCSIQVESQLSHRTMAAPSDQREQCHRDDHVVTALGSCGSTVQISATTAPVE
jgi:hypothetical protein